MRMIWRITQKPARPAMAHWDLAQFLSLIHIFGLLALIPLYFIVVGLMIQPLSDIIPGLWRIIKEPDFLITDYFLVGGIGAAFINAGLLTLAAIGTIYFLGMEMDGHTITSSCLMLSLIHI